MATSLEIALKRHSVSQLRLILGGRGPAMEVAIEELRKVTAGPGGTDPASDG